MGTLIQCQPERPPEHASRRCDLHRRYPIPGHCGSTQAILICRSHSGRWPFT